MKEGGFKGYYTGHSLCRSGTTRLSDAGVPKKECTGHVSDAIDKYMVTSESEREKISNILQADPINVLENVQKQVCSMRDAVEKPIVLKPSPITVGNISN